MATHKIEGPVTQLAILGIQVHTQAMSLNLPGDKLSCILGLVLSWQNKKTVSRRELQSFLGHVNHATMVVLPGQTFLRCMIDLMKIAKHPRHHVS